MAVYLLTIENFLPIYCKQEENPAFESNDCIMKLNST